MGFLNILEKVATVVLSEAAKQAERQQWPSHRSLPRTRRTDAEFERDRRGTSMRATDFQYATGVPLPQAVDQADSSTGVYVLYLHGRVMKCGRAAYGQGIHWRLQQYYSLNYDDRARNGDYWSITQQNRDSVIVSWQCCPMSKCKELEFKLFRKYGKGPWGLRAPQSCTEDDWELLI